MEERREEDKEEFHILTKKIDTLIYDINEINTRSLTSEEKQFVLLAIKREARKEAFREAVIQKTTISLLWSGILGTGVLLWSGLKDHFR